MLELKHISYSVREADETLGILKDISLTVDDHKLVVFTGPNGGGKTTLLRVIEAHGGFTVDCDALYYEMLRENAPMRAALTEAFGDIFSDLFGGGRAQGRQSAGPPA